MTETRKPRIFYGYIVVTAAICAMTIAWGTNRTFGVFLEPMITEFGWTRAAISGPFNLCLVVSGLLGVISGRLSDRFGPRIVVTARGHGRYWFKWCDSSRGVFSSQVVCQEKGTNDRYNYGRARFGHSNYAVGN